MEENKLDEKQKGEIKNLILKTVQEYNKAGLFKDRKLGDTNPSDSYSLVNKRFVTSILSVAAVVTDTHDISSATGQLQAIVHNLGATPRRMYIHSKTDNTTGESTFVYDLQAKTKQGVGLIRLGNSSVVNGSYPFGYDTGSDLIWGGQDMSNRQVAMVHSLDASVLTMKWDGIGSLTTGTVRFIMEFQ